MLTEEEVYNGAKNWLQNNGFLILAGQPPRGVDHLPVIEIKNPTGEKGSRNAYKPDIVAYKEGEFYIIECKPKYDLGDDMKLHNILSSHDRLFLFYRELQQYKLLKKANYNETFNMFVSHINGMLANSETYKRECILKQLVVKSWLGDAEMY